MRALISLELRWFLDGTHLAKLDRWFEDGLPGNEIGDIEKRDDVYLYQPRVDNVGIKLREGKLEIKWRESASPYRGFHDTAGQIERWFKWGWKDPEAPGPGELSDLAYPRGPWLTVQKVRRQRKYHWDGTGFVAAPKNDVIGRGASVEVTGLMLHGRPHGTVAVESFAPDEETQRLVFDAAVEYLWGRFPRDLMIPEGSYGYPHWLGKYGGA